MNTPANTVRGRLEGDEGRIMQMKIWLKTTGSPKSSIDKTNFTEVKPIKEFSVKNFSIKRWKLKVTIKKFLASSSSMNEKKVKMMNILSNNSSYGNIILHLLFLPRFIPSIKHFLYTPFGWCIIVLFSLWNKEEVE